MPQLNVSDWAAGIAIALSIFNTIMNWAVMKEQLRRINAALEGDDGVFSTQKNHEHRLTILETQHRQNHPGVRRSEN
jgi:hypothetical protein